MKKDASLTLYFIPSPYGLNWESPTKLARDILKNYAVKGRFGHTRRFMGHVNIELDYTNDQGEHINILTGMAASDLNAVPLLLKKKIGLGIIFHSFPGKLETKEELIPELDEYFKKGNSKINFAKFKINTETAKRIENYIAEYKKNDIWNYYGLVNSPLHGEGSGCSAFGASFIEVAGILQEEHKQHWANCVKVPHKLLGAPVFDKKVSFFEILLGSHEWANESEDHHELFFWDPDLMYNWVENCLSQKITTANEYTVESIQNTKGLVFDFTTHKTPEKPIFRKVGENNSPVSKLPDFNEKSNYYKYD